MERHRLDVVSLIAGVVLCGIALVALTDAWVVTIADLRWIGPLALVALGVALVAAGGGTGDDVRDDTADTGERPADDRRTAAHDDGVPDSQ